VGDAIFAGSIRRGNQSWDLAGQKVREQIFTLPPETLICPGHGPLTTVAEGKGAQPVLLTGDFTAVDILEAKITLCV